MISGLVYTFAALLSAVATVAAVVYGLSLLSVSLADVISGHTERASLHFLQATFMGIAAYTLVMFSNRIARRSLELFEGEDEGDDEYLYFEEEDDNGEE